jgi:hypothetical protein
MKWSKKGSAYFSGGNKGIIPKKGGGGFLAVRRVKKSVWAPRKRKDGSLIVFKTIKSAKSYWNKSK